MPTYDYKCPECGERDVIQHSMSHDGVFFCGCGSKMVRVLSVGMVRIGAHNETQNGRKVHIPARSWS